MRFQTLFNAKNSFDRQISDLIFANSPDAYLVFGKNGLVHCNKAAENFLGLPKEKLLGLSPADFSPSEQPDGRDAAAAVAENTRQVRKNGWARFEWMHQKPDGTPLPVTVTQLNASIDGQEYQITFWQDIRNLITLREAERVAREKERRQIEAREKAIASFAGSLQRLAEGDLTCAIEAPMVEEYESIRSDFNTTVKELSAIVRKLGANSEAIRIASQEIRNGADQMAATTQHHAAYVEETAAALEEVSVTVSAATARAQSAGEIVRDISGGAAQSSQIADSAIGAMLDIEESSKAINSILATIDSIAFQTNLLALNAGVEAARAGDAGKGFAVVAQEVRELAQRSASAASDIKGLIASSDVHVTKGVELVRETKLTLDGIVSKFGEINHHVDSIVTSAREQSAAIASIKDAVNNIDRMTQKSAAKIQETVDVAHDLSDQSHALNEITNHFTLDAGMTASTVELHRMSSMMSAIGHPRQSGMLGKAHNAA
ncbi:methyl-accepting chemotaxis protein [Agrobacterium pusense]|jgi:methyl-accepting chemotaxis protein|uniref:methyl-accepting chemotaxis protein n=1 Tax=Agrobacterium pusense TaxID=648995 RepID=UPI0037BF4726